MKIKEVIERLQNIAKQYPNADVRMKVNVEGLAEMGVIEVGCYVLDLEMTNAGSFGSVMLYGPNTEKKVVGNE